MKFFPYLIIISLLAHTTMGAEQTPVKNAGFMPSNIWYSKDIFFAGDEVRIYTVIFNGSPYDISGVIEFYDNKDKISEENFSIAGNGRIQDIWTDWMAKEGSHTITGRITKTTTSIQGEAKTPVTLENTVTGEDKKTIDIDTDGDDIGNKIDTDDDDDGLSDDKEIRNGTDPLKKDGVKKSTDNVDQNSSSTQSLVKEEKNILQNKVEEISVKISEAIPEPIKNGISAGTESIENLRKGGENIFNIKKGEKKKEIEDIKRWELSEKNQDEEKNTWTKDKTLAYALFGIFASLQYFFKWPIIFYGIILYTLYRLFKARAYALRRSRY